jgi:hypothetical protein
VYLQPQNRSSAATMKFIETYEQFGRVIYWVRYS